MRHCTSGRRAKNWALSGGMMVNMSGQWFHEYSAASRIEP